MAEELTFEEMVMEKSKSMDIHTTLGERAKKHGDFSDHARVTQAIKQAMYDSPNWHGLPDNMKEALEMDAHKTGRILAGDPFHHDHWHDKVGYITLVADTLTPQTLQKKSKTLLCMRKMIEGDTCVRKFGHEGLCAKYGIGS